MLDESADPGGIAVRDQYAEPWRVVGQKDRDGLAILKRPDIAGMLLVRLIQVTEGKGSPGPILLQDRENRRVV